MLPAGDHPGFGGAESHYITGRPVEALDLSLHPGLVGGVSLQVKDFQFAFFGVGAEPLVARSGLLVLQPVTLETFRVAFPGEGGFPFRLGLGLEVLYLAYHESRVGPSVGEGAGFRVAVVAKQVPAFPVFGLHPPHVLHVFLELWLGRTVDELGKPGGYLVDGLGVEYDLVGIGAGRPHFVQGELVLGTGRRVGRGRVTRQP